MNYKIKFEQIKLKCKRGLKNDIDEVVSLLDKNVDLPTTRAVDFYLSLVANKEGIKQIEFYLFNGTQIQRNYCTLFFARSDNWFLVNKAYKMGLIDRIQAYSR